MEYFVRQIGEFSGSAILILALLIGLSIGWFLRGQININSALNEQVSRWTEFSLLSLKSDLIRVLRFQVITEKPHKDAKGSAVFKPACVSGCVSARRRGCGGRARSFLSSRFIQEAASPPWNSKEEKEYSSLYLVQNKLPFCIINRSSRRVVHGLPSVYFLLFCRWPEPDHHSAKCRQCRHQS